MFHNSRIIHLSGKLIITVVAVAISAKVETGEHRNSREGGRGGGVQM